jgi:hypothetical protein
MESFVNQNWVVNFFDLIHFSLLTFYLLFWSTINLDSLLGFLYVYSLVFFWIFFCEVKMGNNNFHSQHTHTHPLFIEH